MSAVGRVVVAGAGLAGAAAARTLREDGFDGQVVLVGAEHHPPYERPPLSKDYLRGESQKSDAYVEPEQYWAQHDVELRTGMAARRIDLADARLELADGSAVGFDRLLLAPGAAPRTLAVPGGELDGIVTLRRFEDADLLRARAAAAERIVVVGGGWVAAEVAASLRMLGHQITVALRGRAPLEAALGADLAEVYRGLHEEHEVTLMPGARVVAFDGDSAVRRAQTAAGTWLDADLVVVAIGVEPRTDLARAAGLAVADGIAVNAQLATSDPRVFAAGDAALVPHPTLANVLRVEHWGAALAQGTHAARAMLGDTTPYDALPYYFSDQYNTGMECWGDPSLPGEMAVRGELDTRSFTAFWHEEGRVRAVLNMHVHHHAHVHNDGAEHGADQTTHHHDAPGRDGHAGGHVDSAAVESLIRSGAPTRIGALKDPDVPVDALVDAERSSSTS
jgi:3-phenylpropionate/trans-cinnamate dioxygenase ferredoxin reductase subunit